MYCRYSSDNVSRKNRHQTNELKKEFSMLAELIERLDDRLDRLEQAIVDPRGDAYAALAKKHGAPGAQGKKRVVDMSVKG